MNIIKFFSKNKVLTLFFTILLLIFVVGVIGNSLIKDKIQSWSETSDYEIKLIENKITEIINWKQQKLKNRKNEIISHLKNIRKNSFKDFHTELELINTTDLRISIYKNEELFYWNNKYLGQNAFNNSKSNFDEVFLIQSEINSYFAIKDTFSVNKQNFTLDLAKITEKQYNLNQDYFSELSLTEEISHEIGSVLNIEYSPYAKKTKDGRKNSIEIKNDKNNVIGIATFLKPTRENAVKKLENQISISQGVLALIGYLILGLLLINTVRGKVNRILKIVSILVYLVVLRYLLVLIKFPQSLFTSDLFSDKYYFSSFGNGLAYSPIELFITLIIFFGFTYFAFRSAVDYYNSDETKKLKSSIISTISIIICILLYVLLLRGVGAAIRGFVFDTTLRYFQDTSLNFSLPHFIMHINVLLIGLISIIGSAVLMILIVSKLKIKNGKWNFKNAIVLLFILFGAEILYTFLQNNPQLTLLLKFFQIIMVFIAVYLVIMKDLQKITKVIIFFLAASIFSIGSLLFYNTELEKASLKTTANIISRFDDQWYKNLIIETLLSQFSREEAEDAFTNENTNFNSSAFKIWSKSQLQKEAINSSVNFVSLSGNLLGGFGSIYPSLSLNKFIDTNSVLEEIQIFEEPTENNQQKLIRGVFPVKNEFAFIGYLDVSILADMNNFGFSSHPEFISTGKLNDKAILKLDKLIILDYRDDELRIVYGNLNPTQSFNQTIIGAELTKGNDAWIVTNFNNSEYLIYVKGIFINDNSRLLAVALREKELSIGLFDFFKIFFTHSIVLFLIVVIYFGIYYKNKFSYQIDLRAKLLLAFLIISLIPLVLTAFYFRNLTEAKNKDAIYYKLGKRAFSLENFINENYDEFLDYDIYRKASDDLNINYSLFKNNKLEFSSNDLLYDVGLIPKILNPVVYKELILDESQEALITENVDMYTFNSFYYKGNLLGEPVVIMVADGFNNIRLPLSGSEVDVFLFGIYSLAVVLIIIFSALFANQISLPIRKITSATKSVAAGDLSLELKTTAKGELGELVSGFQYMIKELKKNQAMLAEIEREEAWKEMAKQVAHEIKNPLTPMKLSIQQLVAAYNDKSEKFDLFFGRITTTILNQIEALKNIATEFSNFARMPKLKLEEINCVDVINNSVTLFADENVSIIFEQYLGDAKISGDGEQLKRTIINLVRNSIQANSTQINLRLLKNNNHLELFIEDNGTGISKENINKIFESNFTTKIEGMGLGLSLAKRYMNSTGGDISIQKSNNEGTIIKLTFQLSI